MSLNKKDLSRREFIQQGSKAAAGLVAASALAAYNVKAGQKRGSKMRFGLVTYLWGKDWDLPTLIRNCERTNVLGVELRTQHAHGVESNLNARQRYEVKIRFQNSPVTLVGLGTNFAFHYVDQDRLKKEGSPEKRNSGS